MINKNQFSVRNTKKILHKVGKRWVVIAAVLLGIATGGIVATTGVTHAQNVANPGNAKVVNTTGQSTQNNADNQSFEKRTGVSLIPDVNVDNNSAKSASVHSSAMLGVNLAPSVNSNGSVNFNNSNAQSKGNHVNNTINSVAQSLSHNASGISVVDNFSTASSKNASRRNNSSKAQKSSQSVTSSTASKKTSNDYSQSIKNSVAASKSAHSQTMANEMSAANQSLMNSESTQASIDAATEASKEASIASASEAKYNQKAHAAKVAHHSAAMKRKEINNALRSAGNTPAEVAHSQKASASKVHADHMATRAHNYKIASHTAMLKHKASNAVAHEAHEKARAADQAAHDEHVRAQQNSRNSKNSKASRNSRAHRQKVSASAALANKQSAASMSAKMNASQSYMASSKATSEYNASVAASNAKSESVTYSLASSADQSISNHNSRASRKASKAASKANKQSAHASKKAADANAKSAAHASHEARKKRHASSKDQRHTGHLKQDQSLASSVNGYPVKPSSNYNFKGILNQIKQALNTSEWELFNDFCNRGYSINVALTIVYNRCFASFTQAQLGELSQLIKLTTYSVVY